MLLYKISKSFNKNLKNDFFNKLIFLKNVKSVYSHVNIYNTKYQITLSQLTINLYRHPVLQSTYLPFKIISLVHLYFLYKKYMLNFFIKIITRPHNTIHTSKNNYVIEKSYNKIILLL